MWGAAAEQLRAPALATCKNDGNPANSTQRLSGTLANVRPAPARRVPSQCHHLIPQRPLAEIITTTEQHPGHWKVTATPGLRDVSACYHVVRLHAMQKRLSASSHLDSFHRGYLKSYVMEGCLTGYLNCGTLTIRFGCIIVENL